VEERVAEIWRRYIREKGRSSDVAVLIAGGVIFLSGCLIAALDLIAVQHWAYRFDP
jgi:hypothetical protein